MSRKDFAAFAIQDPQSDRLSRPPGICGGDDCGGIVCRLNVFLRQNRCAIIRRPANKLDPEYPRSFRDDPRRLVDRFKFQKSRARCGVEADAFGRPPGNNRCNASPFSRRSGAIGLSFPSARFRASLNPKLIHERARHGVYPLKLFQLPEQPRKHLRLPCRDAGAMACAGGAAMNALAATIAKILGASHSSVRHASRPPRAWRCQAFGPYHVQEITRRLPNGSFNNRPVALTEN
jgi:hypothetical protein